MALSRRGLVAGAVALPWVARGAEPLELRFTMSSFSFGTAALRIADGAGLFAKHGIKPRFIVMESGNAATSALIGGSTEFSVSGPGEVLTARARRQAVVIVANCYRGLAASLVLSKELAAKAGGVGLPVAARLKALDGLAIAEPSATSAYVAPFRDAAMANGARLRLVYMAQPAMPAALTAKAVQGIVNAAPFWTGAVLSGAGVLWISGPGGDLAEGYVPSSTACIQTTAEYARAHPDQIRALQAISEELAALVKGEPEVAKAALGKAYPQMAPEALELAFKAEAGAWTRPRFSEEDIRHEIELLRATGANVAGLDAIKPADVLEFQG